MCVWPLLAIWVAWFFASTDMWGVNCEDDCPVPVLARYGTVVVRLCGTDGTLWYGMGVAGGTVKVRYGASSVWTVLNGRLLCGTVQFETENRVAIRLVYILLVGTGMLCVRVLLSIDFGWCVLKFAYFVWNVIGVFQTTGS